MQYKRRFKTRQKRPTAPPHITIYPSTAEARKRHATQAREAPQRARPEKDNSRHRTPPADILTAQRRRRQTKPRSGSAHQARQRQQTTRAPRPYSLGRRAPAGATTGRSGTGGTSHDGSPAPEARHARGDQDGRRNDARRRAQNNAPAPDNYQHAPHDSNRPRYSPRPPTNVSTSKIIHAPRQLQRPQNTALS